MKSVTAIAPVNIAVIKYWGKRDEELILPLNGSISATLDSSFMCAKTTVSIDESFEKDRLWLNGQEEQIVNKRSQRVLQEIRARAHKNKSELNPDWKIHICSENNFPTAAGLASSSAGLACLVFSLSKLLNVEGDCSDISRMGSGSACRSMHGGWVEWVVGEQVDGTDSVAKQLAPANHWKEMAVVIVVATSQQKHIASTAGQKLSVQTSRLLPHRASTLVPEHLSRMEDFIAHKDFQQFAKLTMVDSNNMHACMQDTHPPIHYLSTTSHHVIRLVHAINDFYARIVVCYTFDAGPNACLFVLNKDLLPILALLSHFYPPIGGKLPIRGIPADLSSHSLNHSLLKFLKGKLKVLDGTVQYLINTRLGEGPSVVEDSQSLLHSVTGLPL